MAENYKIIYKEGTGELVEKKSRFIAQIRPVKSEEEALALVEETRKKYWDARHTLIKEKERLLQQDAVMMGSHPRQPENLCWMF